LRGRARRLPQPAPPCLVAKSYGEDEETDRVHRAVAIAQLIIDVLAETGDDDKIPNAEVRAGIDTGHALVVNNGRKGGREPLFPGSPANKAAKLASNGEAQGIFLTNAARTAIGVNALDEGKDTMTPLTADEIKACQEAAQLGVDKNTIVKEWRKDNDENPIGTFQFSRRPHPCGRSTSAPCPATRGASRPSWSTRTSTSSPGTWMTTSMMSRRMSFGAFTLSDQSSTGC